MEEKEATKDKHKVMEKIPLSETDKTKIRREARDWKVKKINQEIQLKSYERQLDSKMPIMRTKTQIEQAKEQISLNEENIKMWEEQLERDVLLDDLRKNISNLQDEIALLDKNIKIREREIREGFHRDINTGQPLEREKK